MKLYSMDEQEIRRREAGALHQKAARHLQQAQNALRREDFELAAVGAYTAAELAAKGLVLLKPGVMLPFPGAEAVCIKAGLVQF